MSDSLAQTSSRRSRLVRGVAGGALTAALVVAVATTADAAPSYDPAPDVIPALSGFSQLWVADGTNTATETSSNTLHGTVEPGAAKALDWNDELSVWINNNATKTQQFHAIQDSEYNNATNTAYDQSLTISTALGSVLGPIYVKGIEQAEAGDANGLVLTQALVNDSNGTAGAFVGTGAAKPYFSYPRPFLLTDPTSTPSNGTAAVCDANADNASSLAAIRKNEPYADKDGNLKIKLVPDTVDTTHQFSTNDVSLSVGYTGLCNGGAFPSGHTTNAYQSAITLATLLPELAPEILARASENGLDRVVLGVHYPLDVIGGRIDGEVAIAARWSDQNYVKDVLLPARQELLSYFKAQTGTSLQQVVAREKPYTDNPYGGKKIPGGTSQIVTDRSSAVAVYTERLTYGFTAVGKTNLAPSVPTGAENLLLTAFPTLTDAQRTSILAQTEIKSGQPLDLTSAGSGSWERLNLAAALSATVKVGAHGSVTVVKTGGQPTVLKATPAKPVTKGWFPFHCGLFGFHL